MRSAVAILAASLALGAAPAGAGGKDDDEGVRGQAQQQGQGQAQGQTQSATQTVTLGVATGAAVEVPRRAPAIAAPDLVAAPETCMGSTSAGIGLPLSVFGGITFGTTWRSESCERRMNVRALMALGLAEAALALLAQDETVAAALRAAGVRVPAAGPPPGDAAVGAAAAVYPPQHPTQ